MDEVVFAEEEEEEEEEEESLLIFREAFFSNFSNYFLNWKSVWNVATSAAASPHNGHFLKNSPVSECHTQQSFPTHFHNRKAV